MKTIISVFFWAVFGFILASFVDVNPALGLVALQFMNFIPMPKGVLGTGAVSVLTDEQETFAKSIENRVQKLLHEQKTGLITDEQFKLREAAINSDIEKRFGDNKDQLTQLSERISALAEKIDSKKTAVTEKQLTQREAYELMAMAMVLDPSFKDLQRGASKSTNVINFKDVKERAVSVTTDYESLFGKTEFKPELEIKLTKLPAVRDVLRTGSTKKTGGITHPFAKDFNCPVDEYSENAAIQPGTFKFDTAQSFIQRFGVSFDISKNYLLDDELASFVGMIMENSYAQMVMRENFLFLNGKGGNGFIEGLLKKAPVLSISNIAFAAGSVASIAAYGSTQTIVNFTNEHDLKTGHTITFANATEGTYNAAFAVTRRSLKSIVINKAYIAEADTSAWTATAVSPFYHAKDGAKLIDALRVLIISATFKEFMPTGGFINPALSELLVERDSLGQPINEDIDDNAERLIYKGVTFIKTDACPLTTVLVGDMRKACEVKDLQNLTMQIVYDDKTSVLENTYTVVLSKQTGLPIYNQYVLLQGDLKTIQTAIEKP